MLDDAPATALLARHAWPIDAVPERSRLTRMELAATRVVECMQSLHQAGENVISVAVGRSASFTQWEHYPCGEVRDPCSGAQYYFHCHPPDQRADPDFGHFHTFIASPAGGADAREESEAGSSGTALANICHLVAISMNPAGMPVRLFTTNRWVTAETWQDAPAMIAQLDQFTIHLDHPCRWLNQWLTELLVLFRPQIEQLLLRRDAAIARWLSRYPGTDVFENRALEVTSSIDVSLSDHIEWLDRLLKPGS